MRQRFQAKLAELFARGLEHRDADRNEAGMYRAVAFTQRCPYETAVTLTERERDDCGGIGCLAGRQRFVDDDDESLGLGRRLRDARQIGFCFQQQRGSPET